MMLLRRDGACACPSGSHNKEENRMKYICKLCGWEYDEAEQGVKWEDLPEDFACELCGAGKDEFEPAE